MGEIAERRPKIEPPSLPAWALSTAGEVPEWVKIGDLQAAVSMLVATTRPASIKECAVAFDRLFAFGRTFGLGGGDTAAAVKFYQEALADLPAWALERVIDSTCHNWRWSNKMPLPADLREHVPEAWRLEVARLKRAQRAIAARREGDDPPACVVWFKYEAELRAAVGEEAWRTWLSQVVPEHDDGHTLVLAAPSRFIADHVKRTYGKVVMSIMGRRLDVKPRTWCSKALATRKAVSGSVRRV